MISICHGADKHMTMAHEAVPEGTIVHCLSFSDIPIDLPLWTET